MGGGRRARAARRGGRVVAGRNFPPEVVQAKSYLRGGALRSATPSRSRRRCSAGTRSRSHAACCPRCRDPQGDPDLVLKLCQLHALATRKTSTSRRRGTVTRSRSWKRGPTSRPLAIPRRSASRGDPQAVVGARRQRPPPRALAGLLPPRIRGRDRRGRRLYRDQRGVPARPARGAGRPGRGGSRSRAARRRSPACRRGADPAQDRGRAAVASRQARQGEAGQRVVVPRDARRGALRPWRFRRREGEPGPGEPVRRRAVAVRGDDPAAGDARADPGGGFGPLDRDASRPASPRASSPASSATPRPRPRSRRASGRSGSRSPAAASAPRSSTSASSRSWPSSTSSAGSRCSRASPEGRSSARTTTSRCASSSREGGRRSHPAGLRRARAELADEFVPGLQSNLRCRGEPHPLTHTPDDLAPGLHATRTVGGLYESELFAGVGGGERRRSLPHRSLVHPKDERRRLRAQAAQLASAREGADARARTRRP